MSFDNIITFTALEFHAALTTLFFIDFMHRILVEGFDVASSMKHILTAVAQSSLARHTNILLMHCVPGSLSIASTLYVFTNPRWHPWGHCLSPTCPVCASLHTWSNEFKKGPTYSFACTPLAKGLAVLTSQRGLNCVLMMSREVVG